MNLVTPDDTTTAGTFYPLWNSGGTTQAKTSSSKLSFNPSTGTLTATAFVGNVTAADDTTTNITAYPLFSSGATSALKTSSSKLTFNPSTGTLTATKFVGDGSGLTGISGGGVTSFSGDGTLLNNSSSTGAVTASLANAGAHKFWGNNTGSTAAPGYQSIGLADLPARPFVIPAEWNGIPSTGQVLRTFIVPTYSTTALTITIPANCAQFGANVTTAATGSTAFTVKKNGSAICTLTVSSACTGTSCVTAGTGGSQTTLTSNDVLTITGGGDTTLAGISFSISASVSGGAL